MKKVSTIILATVFCGAIISSCKKNENETGNNNNVAGFLYTTTNGEGANNVVKFTRHQDGTLSDETSYATNSNGGANVGAGGDAHGDFDAQGAIQIIGNYLLTVNAGGKEVSVFSLERATGNLTFKNNVGSGGTRPVSIAYTKKVGSENDYWVVVGNQWNNPNIQKDGAAIERYPNNEFFAGDLSAPDASDAQRNIQLFSFSKATGLFSAEKLLDTYSRKNGGPTTVSFSDDGTKLAVSTWGIAHFNTANTSTTEQRPSRVYIYDFSGGNISGKRFFEEEGISGTIGFSWAKGSNSRIFASNFNLVPTKRDNSLTELTDNGASINKTGNYSVTSALGINEACWTALNPAGNTLYVASFATNLISSFNVGSTSLIMSGSEARAGIAPAGDSKDIFVTPDNKYLYNLGAFQSFSINRFNITGNSVNYKSQSVLTTTTGGTGTAGKYNFLGLTGFDINK